MAIGVGGIFGVSTYWFLACCLYLEAPVCAAAGTVVPILVAWSFSRSFSQPSEGAFR